MDTIEYYGGLIDKLIHDYARIPPANEPDVHNEVLIDNQRHRYLLLSVGWSRGRRVHDVVLHLDIQERQVWIQANNTDQLVAEELVEAGIPKEAIVLGMQPPEVRSHTGYGTPLATQEKQGPSTLKTPEQNTIS